METISYEMVCQILNHHLGSTKILYQVKYEVLSNVIDVEIANIFAGLKLASVIDSQLSGLNSLIPSLLSEWLSIK